ncbi:hypothetical protein NLI96_g657 [Meripilus lineatus]|uniref:Uncharacterized protein n=1 Tax=Meripilus lineatus TaxID=2056292 RepID=A0AAD5VG82_9APHY|nr:hypothetical protein NLI96_g657 [Physisporinus lineatus]
MAQVIDPIALIQNWLNQERGMRWAPQWDGGYERWAQGAWAVYFDVNYNGAITAQPEPHVYVSDGQRADLVFQAHGHNPASVEMKCKLSGDDEKKFTDKVWADVKKSKTGLNGHWANLNTTRWVIALSVSPNDTERKKIGELLAVGTQGGFAHSEVHAYATGPIDIWSWSI